MDRLKQVLEEIGLGHLFDTFVSGGFWSWEALCEITEQEL